MPDRASPALANERIKVGSNGDDTLKLKSPYRDGTTHLVMTGLEFMQKLAALVLRPRLNLIRYHGVLAPLCPLGTMPSGGLRLYRSPSRTLSMISQGKNRPFLARQNKLSRGCVYSSAYSIIDMERCPNCQGRLTISSPAHPCARAISASLHVITAIEDPSTIAKILKHLGLPARAPPRAPAKNPAFYEFTEFTSPLLRIREPAALVRPCTLPLRTLIAACHAMINGLARPPRRKRPVAEDKNSSSRPVPVQRSSKTRRVTYLAAHSRRFLALSLRNMEVDFWKKAVYASYPLSRLGRWSLNISRCSTIVSGVMRKSAIKYPLILLTNFTPAGNNLRHNPDDLPVH